MGLMEEALAQTGGGGNWHKFEQLGDTLQGEIVSMTVRQASDFNTKLPAVSSSGKPKMQLVIGVRIGPPVSEEDDGVRLVDVNLWGMQRDALMDAVKAFGREGEVGDYIRVEYLGKQKPAYTSSLGHAYRYALKAGAPKPPAQAPAQPDAWSAPGSYGDDTPF